MGSPTNERTSLLVIRMWLESAEASSFRARVGEIADLRSDLQHSAVFGTPEAAIAYVEEHIRRFVSGEIGLDPAS